MNIEEFKEAQRMLTLNSQVNEMLFCMLLIEELRADEGNSVTILCPNPEPENREESEAVECLGEWTAWEEQRFSGATLKECLESAVRAYREYKK